MDTEDFRPMLAARLQKAVDSGFGGCVKDAATSAGMSRTQLCAYLSASRCPNASQLRALCIGLRVSADYLLGTERSMPDPQTLAIARRIEALPKESRDLLDEITMAIARHAS